MISIILPMILTMGLYTIGNVLYAEKNPQLEFDTQIQQTEKAKLANHDEPRMQQPYSR